ncbi:uncharacterized protein ACOB8E_015082 isoform 3-T3 [Sarcophilus harrisii]
MGTGQAQMSSLVALPSLFPPPPATLLLELELSKGKISGTKREAGPLTSVIGKLEKAHPNGAVLFNDELLESLEPVERGRLFKMTSTQSITIYSMIYSKTSNSQTQRPKFEKVKVETPSRTGMDLVKRVPELIPGWILVLVNALMSKKWLLEDL